MDKGVHSVVRSNKAQLFCQKQVDISILICLHAHKLTCSFMLSWSFPPLRDLRRYYTTCMFLLCVFCDFVLPRKDPYSHLYLLRTTHWSSIRTINVSYGDIYLLETSHTVIFAITIS